MDAVQLGSTLSIHAGLSSIGEAFLIDCASTLRYIYLIPPVCVFNKCFIYIDDISSDDDDLTEASAIRTTQPAKGTFYQPPSSYSSSDVEKPEERRLSAFASVQSKPPRQKTSTEQMEMKPLRGKFDLSEGIPEIVEDK